MAATPRSAIEIQGWLVTRLAGLLKVDPGTIGALEPFADFGLTSWDAVGLSGELEEWLGTSLSPVLLYEHPTIAELARHLAGGETSPTLVEPPPAAGSEPVAIVGMACRFPGAASLAEYWTLLRDGVDAIREVPRERWDLRAFYDPEVGAPGKMTTRWGGFLDRVDAFDGAFFGISPLESERMDPQQRLLLEVAWEALEDAGVDPDSLSRARTGVFVAISTNDYSRIQMSDPALVDPYGGTGNALSIAANRISYLLDLHGPSVAVDTACSSSLVALHLACQSLASGESGMALVGGVNVILSPETTILFSKAGLMAPDGRCKVFDAAADGYVRGEGAGVVVLKPLSRALADGDRIHALIRGSAVNQDGRTNGLMAPSGPAQAEVLREAYVRSGAEPGRVQYVEAHGTGTALGDPLETNALGAVVGQARRDRPCRIGSVKSNIGHLEAAAGMAGLIKVALALHHRELPPSLHFRTPSPHIPFERLGLEVQSRLEPWPESGGPALAGVSAFGFGGTNAHVILEEPPVAEPGGSSRPWQLLTLSARSAAALDRAAANLAGRLEETPVGDLPDVAYTLQVGRKAFEHRRTLVVRDTEDAIRALRAPESTPARPLRDLAPRPVAFLFPGLGDQYSRMAAGLLRQEPTFRRTVDHCAELLRPRLGLDLRDLLHAEDGEDRSGRGEIDLRRMLGRDRPGAGEPQTLLSRTRFAHPALFVVEHALAELLAEWGLHPRAMLGYSLGEYVAACRAGVFSLEDALALVAERARRIDELPPGRLLAAPLGEDDLAPLLGDALSIAAVNGPALCVVSGPPEAVEDLAARLAEREIPSRPLQASHAFHSSQMEALFDGYADLVRSVALHPPRIPFLSNVTGTWIRPEEATDPAYWATHMCRTVRFADGVGELLRMAEAPVLLEVGPGQNLGSFVKQHPGYGESAPLVLPTLPHAFYREEDGPFLLRSLGRIWEAGVDVDWRGFHAHESRRRVALPTYPFEPRRHWLEPGARTAVQPAAGESRAPFDEWFYQVVWKPAARIPEDGPAAGPILVLADPGAGERLASRLEEAGRAVVLALSGNAFAETGERRFTVRPREREDYEALFHRLGEPPADIVHLWTLERSQGAHEETRSFYSLLALSQALARSAPGAQVRLTVVSQGVHEVTGDEPLRPGNALLLGPCRVLPLEHPGLVCRNVDLAEAEPGSGDEAWQLDRLLEELAGGSPEEVVVYRGRERLCPAVEPVSLDEPGEKAARLREGGVYLITGGLGGLGLAMARHLSEACKARLALLSRTATAERLREVEAIEALGSEVLVIEADVADPAAMREAVSRTVERFGGLDGVIHAAGVPGSGLSQRKTAEEAAAVLAPKVRGTLALEEALAGRDLDFLVLFSSVTALVGGGPGQVDYCAANAFLDAFARRRSRSGRFTVAVDWAEWQWDAWQHGLLGFHPELREYLRENRRKFGIRAEEGAEALRRILAGGLAQVVVSPRRFEALLAESRSFTTGNIVRGLRGDLPGARPRPQAAAIPASGELERGIAAVWQRCLGVQRVAPHDNFFDLGGNSLIGLQVAAELRKEFGVELAPLALFETPTPAGLAKALRGEERPEPPRRAAARPAAGGVAIVGMAGRFPGAANVDELWQNLLDGRETVTFFSDEELLAAGVDAELLKDPGYVKAGSVLEGIDLFDAELFGYSPREAELMDPQQRLFLQCAWEALENAGYDPDRFAGSIGVFGGSSMSTYLLNLASSPEAARSINVLQAGLGNSSDSLTTRVSYKLNLRGPSVAVQTFCSTSAVAVHLACRSLLSGECDMALAGGVRVAVPHRAGYLWEPGGIDSPDGHTRTFDARGRGAIVGNGVALVLLKPLEKALADGDTIHAVIRGSAVNNDGSAKVGYTAPSVDVQAQVIAEALEAAGVEPAAIGYVEAHGTATELGDPIEAAALTKVYGSAGQGVCAIGSVKTNMGHLDRAAGVTSLIKTALSLRHGVIPPSLHFETPNPKLNLESSPFYVQTRLTEWPAGPGRPRRAGVNALGIGGTNAHFVLEEPPAPSSGETLRPRQLLLLSAHTETALESLTQRLAEHLESGPDLADVAYTLQVGRQVLSHRRMVVCRDAADAVEALGSLDVRRVSTWSGESRRRPVVFLFPGLGDHYPGMAAELYRQEPTFREVVDRCADLLRPELGVDVREALFSEGTDVKPDLRALFGRGTRGDRETDEATRRLNETWLTQPSVFVVEYALACLLQEWSLMPQAMIGYSLGEYVAACLAGVFSLEDALLLVARRARSIHGLPAGAMLAVPMGEEQARTLLGDSLSLAAVNGPSLCVLAGPLAEVEALEARLTREGVACRRLQTVHAFHSSMMEPLADAFAELVDRVEKHPPRIPYLSNVTGTWITADQATDPGYWVRHLCEPVRFEEGIRELLKDRDRLLLEVGPGQTLGSFFKQHPQWSEEQVALPVLRPSYQQVSDQELLLGTLGKLWLAGVELDWPGFYRHESRRRVPLPTYPFEGKRYWIGPDGGQSVTAPKKAATGKKPDPAEWFYQPVWRESSLPAAEPTESRWLIFIDGGGLGSRLAESLSGSLSVDTVSIGEGFQELEPGSWVLDPCRPEGYRELMRSLREAGRIPNRIVHLWTVTEGGLSFDVEQELGFYSLIHLAQALGEQRITSPLRLEVVTSRVQPVLEGEPVEPGRWTVLAPCKVIPQEYPHITCRSIDVDDINADGLAAELHGASSDLAVAWRGGSRWVQVFEPVRLEAGEVESRLRPQGVYLITGG
ncbi:MAG TPA: SDR family NAD(P)-dependent oxidoreductase, partial [Thermoanaerobaculia bacterium]|nr:SDR family NAD(P)-dependent oxidoreductase [Thermoanaerobaculia bacterium]